MRKIREVLRLKAEARLSDREIAGAIGASRSTVQECLRRAREAGLSWHKRVGKPHVRKRELCVECDCLAEQLFGVRQ